jgi:hypothetical protein
LGDWRFRGSGEGLQVVEGIVLVEGDVIGEAEGVTIGTKAGVARSGKGPVAQVWAIDLAKKFEPITGEWGPTPAAELTQNPRPLGPIGNVGAVKVVAVELK